MTALKWPLLSAKAYQLKLTLEQIYSDASDTDEAPIPMNKWYQWVVRCRLDPVKEFAKTTKHNWSGVIRYFDSRITNGVIEGVNSVVQAARTRVRGYRNIDNYISKIYLLAGKLTYIFFYYIKRCKDYR